MIDIMSGTDGDERLTGKESKKGRAIGTIVVLLLVAGAATGGTYWYKAHNQRAAAVDPQSSENAVRAADAAWAKAAASHNIEGTLAFYADDAVVMPPNEAMAMDRGAQRKAWADILTPGTDISFSAGKVEAATSGDLVYDVGIYTLTTKTKKGKVTNDGGKYLAVWKKQADGSWKAVASTWNSDKALPGTVNAGG
jgi:ketosteroid isomerase-like protein